MVTSQRALLTRVEREVRACRPLALRYFRSPDLSVERKPDDSPVTAADRAVEARLRRALERLCPGEAIVGEEYGRSGPDGSSYWTIDPIDGTRAFSCGLPSWGILVSRVEHGQPRLGVCDYPALGLTLSAAHGVGAYDVSHKVRRRLPTPRRVASLGEAVIFHGGLRWWQGTPFASGFQRLIRACYLERAYGDCYGYLWAFWGYADAVIDYGVKVWDMAPLAALAQATGRVLVDFSGRPNFHGPETIMASPSMAQSIVRVLRATGNHRPA